MIDILSNLTVFICCHDDDVLFAKDLSKRLYVEGIKTQLSESVLPGQEKNLEIYKAMRSSDAVIVCVSSRAMEAEGNIHREIKYAMSIQEEKPQGTIFFIPIRLEACEIPFQLKHLEWCDYFDPDGFIKLIKALEMRADQLNTLATGIHIGPNHPPLKNTVKLLDSNKNEQAVNLIEVDSYINKFRVLSNLKSEGIKEELIEEYERKLLDQILPNRNRFIER